MQRAPHPTDRRQVLVTLTDAALELIAEDRRRREAWLVAHLADLDADERGAAAGRGPGARTAGGRPVTPTFVSLGNRNFRPVRDRAADLQHRDVDAARRAGLAGPVADRRVRHRPRHHHRAAVPADAAVGPVGRRGRRPAAQAAAPARAPRPRSACSALVLGRADRHRARRRSGRSTCWRSCSASPPSSTTRSGSPSSPEMVGAGDLPNAVALGSATFKPGRAGRAGRRRRADRRRRHRLGVPHQRPSPTSPSIVGLLLMRTARAAPDRAGAPRGRASCARACGTSRAGTTCCWPIVLVRHRRHLRLQLPDHDRADGHAASSTPVPARSAC